jgi:aminopeptidase
MNNFEQNLEKYARLAVEKGINLKEKEGLIVTGNTYTLPLMRHVVKVAYELGAKHVEIMISDDQMSIIRYENGKDFVFENAPEWKIDMFEALYKDNYHHLFISAQNPELLKEIPTDLIAKDQKTMSQASSRIVKYRMDGTTKWNIIAMPPPQWALSVFPNDDETTAIEKLWEKIFLATRVDHDNPVESWNTHDSNLKKYVNYLNEKQFEKMVYKGPGTDLEVYLAVDHEWVGGSKESQKNGPYFPNIPTEEVFSTPYKTKVNGTLKSTKPLSLNGKLVDDFGFTFKDGKVIDFYANKGYDTLAKLLDNDDGARYLGEIALVGHDSPISNTGILFNNTLFDENASCHFALGRCIAFAMQNGSELTNEDLENKGANFSLIHVDFMVGGPELEITAYEKNGNTVKIFEKGNWAF